MSSGVKIDIIKWSSDPEEYISSSLSPAKVVRVDIDEETRTARVIVPDFQLSLAIGKEGQNARLAARLTGWRIDIKSESQLRAAIEQQMFNMDNGYDDGYDDESDEYPEDGYDYDDRDIRGADADEAYTDEAYADETYEDEAEADAEQDSGPEQE